MVYVGTYLPIYLYLTTGEVAAALYVAGVQVLACRMQVGKYLYRYIITIEAFL